MTRLRIGDALDSDVVLSSKPVLIGGGTDGASVNIGQHHSMRAQLQGCLNWFFGRGVLLIVSSCHQRRSSK